MTKYLNAINIGNRSDTLCDQTGFRLWKGRHRILLQIENKPRFHLLFLWYYLPSSMLFVATQLSLNGFTPKFLVCMKLCLRAIMWDDKFSEMRLKTQSIWDCIQVYVNLCLYTLALRLLLQNVPEFKQNKSQYQHSVQFAVTLEEMWHGRFA